MPTFLNIPIKRRLTIISTLTSSVALLLGALTIFGYEQFESRKTLIGEISTESAILGDTVGAALSGNDAASALQTLKSLAVDPNIDGAVVYDDKGRLFASYRNGASVEGLQFAPPPVAPNGHRFGENSLQVFHEIDRAGEKVGTVLVQSDLDDIYLRDSGYVAIAAVVVVAASILAFLLSAGLLAPVSGPIAHLADVVGTVARDKDYSVRARKQSDDELGQLIDGFNDMLSQVQARDGALEQARRGLERRVEERTHELQQEIVERKDAEAALRSSEERLASAFEDASTGMALVSPEGLILKVNRAFCTLTGYAAEELAGMSFRDLTHPDDLAADNEFVRRMLAGEIQTYQMEKRYCHKLHRIVWALLSVSLVRDASGHPLHFIGQVQDITERKQAQQALVDSETRLRALIENSSDIIAVAAIDGRLQYVSPSIRKIGGYEPEELIGHSFLELAHPDEAAAAVHDFEELLRQPGLSLRVERRYRHKNNSWIDAEVVAVNLAHVPGVAGVVTALRDITERKRAELELEQTHKKLLEASRLGGMAEVATSVLHNVGNVLNSVNVSATLAVEIIKNSRSASLARVVALLRDHEADLGSYISTDPKGRQIPAFLDQLSKDWQLQQASVVKELESLTGHIDHIKGIVVMQQNYATFSGATEIVDVRELVDDSLHINEGSLNSDHVHVIREFEEVPLISVEKHKVLQILVNLVRNATHACEHLDGTSRRITLRVAQADGRIRISVSDNGVGIAPENLTRIFAHGFTTRKAGHGFGLHSGSLTAVELRGSLRVQSEGLGKGATFTLELPGLPSAIPG